MSLQLLCCFNYITMSLQLYYYIASILLLCHFNITMSLQLYYYITSILLLCRFNITMSLQYCYNMHAIHALYVACPHPSFLSLNCMIASRLSLHSLLFPLEEKKLKYMQSMQYMQYMSRLDVRSSRLVGVVSVPARRPVVLARRPVVPARRPVVPARRIKGPAWHEGSASNPRKPKSAK